jgi:hypothetical protein
VYYVQAVKLGLYQVITNLFSNAIVFTGRTYKAARCPNAIPVTPQVDSCGFQIGENLP